MNSLDNCAVLAWWAKTLQYLVPAHLSRHISTFLITTTLVIQNLIQTTFSLFLEHSVLEFSISLLLVFPNLVLIKIYRPPSTIVRGTMCSITLCLSLSQNLSRGIPNYHLLISFSNIIYELSWYNATSICIISAQYDMWHKLCFNESVWMNEWMWVYKISL